MSALRLVIHRRVPRLQVHFARGAECWASLGYTVWQSGDSGEGWRPFAALPVGAACAAAAKHELCARLLRAGIHALLPLDSGWAAVAGGALFRISADGNTVQKLCEFPRGKRPLRRGICVVKDTVYFGEYFSNSGRGPVYVYRVDPADGRLSIVHEFPAQSVRHIHVVQPDVDGTRLWIGTGDSDSECRLLTLDPVSGATELVGGGSQQWRAVSLAVDAAGIIWGTDNHLGANHLWRWERGSRAPACLGPVTGPAYYHTRVIDSLVFGATMEKGEGEQDGFARLYTVNGHSVPQEVWRLKKDSWNARYFGYGVFEFAEGSADGDRFWVTAKGLEGGLCSYLLSLAEETNV